MEYEVRMTITFDGLPVMPGSKFVVDSDTGQSVTGRFLWQLQGADCVGSITLVREEFMMLIDIGALVLVLIIPNQLEFVL